MNITITDHASSALAYLGSERIQRDLPKALGGAIAELVQRHFLALPPNKNDWPMTNFWGGAANSTFNDPLFAAPGQARVSIHKIGVRQQIEGGDINPTPGHTFLAFPANEGSYGHQAGEYRGNPDYKFGSALNPATGRTQRAIVEKSTGKPWFWLATHAHQNPHPEDLPAEEQMVETIKTSAAAFFLRN
jgi:hypothetical protein